MRALKGDHMANTPPSDPTKPKGTVDNPFEITLNEGYSFSDLINQIASIYNEIRGVHQSSPTATIVAHKDIPTGGRTIGANKDIPGGESTIAANKDIPVGESTIAANKDIPGGGKTIGANKDIPGEG
jgi:hypothetical protein